MNSLLIAQIKALVSKTNELETTAGNGGAGNIVVLLAELARIVERMAEHQRAGF